MTDRTTLLALAERVEKAEGPDRALDLAICRGALFSAPLGHAADMPDDLLLQATIANPTPRYTSSLDAALTLVPEGWKWEVYSDGAALMWRQPSPDAIRQTRTALRCATPALALTAAALRARAEEMKE